MTRTDSPKFPPALTCGCFTALWFFSANVAGHDGTKFTISAGVDVTHGDYGQVQSTDSYTLPVTISYSISQALTASLTIPYIYQSNNGTVPLGDNRYPMRGADQASSFGSGNQNNPANPGNQGNPGNMGGGNMGNPGHMDPSGNPGQSAGMNPSSHSSPPEYSDESQSGLGDLSLTVNYRLLDESAAAPGISTQFYVKFPSADDDKSLGTGAYDYGVGLWFGKWFDNWQLGTHFLYVMPGSTSSFDPDNYWEWSLTTGHILNDNLMIGFTLDGATAPFPENEDLLELQLHSDYWISDRTSIGTFVSFGLSDGSSDYSAGIYGAFNF